MPKINKTKFAILGMLLHGPMSGYDIKKFSDLSISFFWSENYGHIYPILKRMTSEGLVKKRIERTSGKPDRHVYTITKKGRNSFLEWMKKSPEKEIRRNEFLLKLFFSGILTIPDVINLIEFEKNRNQKILDQYKEISKEYIPKIDFSGTKKFAYLVLDYGEKLTSTRLKWCEEVLQIMRLKLKEQASNKKRR